jgi:hypothetical protein
MEFKYSNSNIYIKLYYDNYRVSHARLDGHEYINTYVSSCRLYFMEDKQFS